MGSAVFEVSCAVELTRPLNILSLCVTIAKQTVPGDGIFSKDCDILPSLVKKLFAVARGLELWRQGGSSRRVQLVSALTIRR